MCIRDRFGIALYRDICADKYFLRIAKLHCMLYSFGCIAEQAVDGSDKLVAAVHNLNVVQLESVPVGNFYSDGNGARTV